MGTLFFALIYFLIIGIIASIYLSVNGDEMYPEVSSKKVIIINFFTLFILPGLLAIMGIIIILKTSIDFTFDMFDKLVGKILRKFLT